MTIPALKCLKPGWAADFRSGSALYQGMDHKNALERAFELADEGISNQHIRLTLIKEGLNANQLCGPHIFRQLREHRMRSEERRKSPGRCLCPHPVPTALSSTYPIPI
jgi:hypothetical protein